MNKLKTGKKYEIKWIDCIGYHGWYERNAIEELVKDYIVKTVGFFIKRMKLFIVIAQSYQTKSGQYGNIKYIPKRTIINIREIK